MHTWVAGRGSFLFFLALMMLYVNMSFGRTEKSMDLLLLMAKWPVLSPEKCPSVTRIAFHLGSFQLQFVARCGSFHAYFVFPIKENFGCLERICFSTPKDQTHGYPWLLLVALENTVRIPRSCKKKAISMHLSHNLFVEIYPRYSKIKSWKFRVP